MIIRYIYNVLFLFSILFVIIYNILFKSFSSMRYVLSPEKFGFYKDNDIKASLLSRPIWIHAVSLGETRASQSLVKHFLHKGNIVVLTCITLTAKEEGARLFGKYINKKQLLQVFIPYDLSFCVDRFFRYYNPYYGIIIEREIWPNLIMCSRKFHIPISLVSARLSDRSFNFLKIFNIVFPSVIKNFSLILTQSNSDSNKFVKLGFDNPIVVGNIKFDIEIPLKQVKNGLAWKSINSMPIIVIASTREGEEELFIESIKQSKNKVVFIIVPRHPNRFNKVASLLTKNNISFDRISDLGYNSSLNYNVLLGDSVGEMFFYYSAADIVIVAGSFKKFGGHNLIEPALVKVPIIIGPYTYNFEEVSLEAVYFNAALRVSNAHEAVLQAIILSKDRIRKDLMKKGLSELLFKYKGLSNKVIKLLEIDSSKIY